ncbi:MAG TPA: XRE family transcriptional regulator [Candidatus Elarobacter sp.]|jgi:transcriptional regulator with XRE-family HTH domain
MAKSVLETINEYAQDADARERLATADLELELCDRMVDLREKAGLTQAGLAAKLGFTQAYVAKLENGGFEKCGIGTLRTFARALGHEINIDNLFTPAHYMSRAHLFFASCNVVSGRAKTAPVNADRAAIAARAEARAIDGARAA